MSNGIIGSLWTCTVTPTDHQWNTIEPLVNPSNSYRPPPLLSLPLFITPLREYSRLAKEPHRNNTASPTLCSILCISLTRRVLEGEPYRKSAGYKAFFPTLIRIHSSRTRKHLHEQLKGFFLTAYSHIPDKLHKLLLLESKVFSGPCVF